jgi:hypothetical protein
MTYVLPPSLIPPFSNVGTVAAIWATSPPLLLKKNKESRVNSLANPAREERGSRPWGMTPPTVRVPLALFRFAQCV